MSSNAELIRSAISQIVSAIVPFDRSEEEHIDFVKSWIASGAEIFRGSKSDMPHIHLVAYFMVVDQNTNRFLLVDHKKAGLWLPPGGHVEVNEHPKETVRREAQEELGMETYFLFEDPLFLTVTNTVGEESRHTDVSLWYVLKGDRCDDLKYDATEFRQIRWFDRQDIPFGQTDPHMKRFIDKIGKKLVTLNTYDASVDQYSENTQHLHPKEEAQRFISMLPSKDAKIIDIGCGPGRDAKIFSDYGMDVVGIDFSSKMVDCARRHVPACAFHVMDIESLAFPPETFDGAWVSCALLHIPKKNMPAVLKKIHAILKSNGSLYVSVKENAVDEMLAPDARYAGLEKYWSFYQQEEWINLVSSAGFEIVKVVIANIDTNYDTHPVIKVFAKKQNFG